MIVYLLSAISILLSGLLMVILPLPSEFRSLFVLPILAGLFTLIGQGWRDQLTHERSKELIEKQQNFDLAVASHMSQVLFDKQVDFCEEYTQEFQAIVYEMIIKGATKEIISGEDNLRKIRLKYSPWVSNELTEDLLPFEKGLREIYSNVVMSEAVNNRLDKQDFQLKAWQRLSVFLGLNEKPDAAGAVIGHLKSVLGIPELEKLRHLSIQTAIKQLENNK